MPPKTITTREQFPKTTPESRMTQLVALRIKAGAITSSYYPDGAHWTLETQWNLLDTPAAMVTSVARATTVQDSPIARQFGTDVVFLQRLLRAGGYYKHDVDGLVGPLTIAALELFQQDGSNLRQELGSFDDRTERAIATMLTPTQRAARKFMSAIASAGLANSLSVRIISGTRTFAEQDEIFAQGRTKPGAIVTAARGGQSNHNYGIAWDVGIFTSQGSYIDTLAGAEKMSTKAVAAEYAKLGPVGRNLGLFWGGDWRKPDRPHYQMLDNDELLAVRGRFLSGERIV